MADSELPELFAAAREGDLDAFTRLVAPYRRRLAALIQLRLDPRVRRVVQPDDVMQDCLLRAFEALPRAEWAGERAFVAWLTAIAKNQVGQAHRRHLLAERRSATRQQSLHERLDRAPAALEQMPDPGPLRGLRREERFDRLRRAIDRLAPQHREVVLLCRIECRPLREVAEQIGRSPQATSMLLLRALKALRREFGETESLGLPARSLAPPNGSSTDGAST